MATTGNDVYSLSVIRKKNYKKKNPKQKNTRTQVEQHRKNTRTQRRECKMPKNQCVIDVG